MIDTLTRLLEQYGYIGIILLITAENLFPPIPSEIILPFSGFLTTCTALTPVRVILCATLGSTIGAVILYAIGYWLSGPRLEKFLFGRFGKYLHFNRDDIDYTIAWFQKKGKYSVFFCRCIPIMRSLISIPAGMAHMHWLTFTLMTITGSAIWNIILIYLGRFAGNSWQIATDYISSYGTLTKISLIAALILFLLYRFMKHRLKNRQKHGN